MPSRTAGEPEECFDMQELASQAADAVEAYRRAPWRQLSGQVRMARLRRAIELLQRIEDLETGRIPMPVWGD
jgi:acyl-CoA reductase-like NAD-dependent aldehyde dehydrogenase